ncbi:cation diffusion facilitator family transporter [Clostridium aceticum]|uniref:Cation diffusion facilitator family transporter n=1 Tax=Clostridium aceticum TaxID=84022 RepID=A0A0D8IH62_9CLOT|nr:cation diffusion facilitator family transporter [Clostridium aceticum]AKL94135.1 cation diffusion facilitator family transporter [Clostridium aceticum]KJF28516.1 cation diffusion facilitator family transporter [Clostridium aceticum]
MKLNEQESFFSNKINRVIFITIIMNVFLVLMKLGAGHFSGSKALIADGLHSASDIVTSIGVIIGIGIAKKPRDEQHQYGHEKVETIAAFLLSIALIYTGIKIGLGSALSIIHKDMVIPGKFALYAALLSIVIKELQYQITFKVGKEANSSALMADAWHHRSDALSSIAAFIGVLGGRLGFTILDPLAGVVVSAIVMKVGIEIFIDCFQQLIDVSIQLKELESVKHSILRKSKVQCINDIRTRKHGSKVFVDIRVCVDATMDIYNGHCVAEEVENIIRSEVNNVKDVIVHLDPFPEESQQKEVI